MSDTPPPMYGTQAAALPKRLGEKLRELWEPHEYVRIMNIDDETFYWQVLSPQDERYDIDRGPTKITYRNPPKQYSLKPGESMPLEGWNAYVAVEQLLKKVTAKNMNVKGQQQKDSDGRPMERIINWEDPHTWDVYLPRIFMGRETPKFGDDVAAKPINDVEVTTPVAMTASGVEAKSTGNYTVQDLAKELGVELPS